MYKLREIRRSDMSAINVWRNDPEMIEKLLAPFRYISSDVDCKWFEDYMQNRNAAVRCAIVETACEDKIIGIVSIVDIDPINRTAGVGIMLDKEYRSKGIGFFAFKTLLDHAFNNMNLNRIAGDVLEYNTSSKKLLEKLGFITEGVKRQAVYKNGRYVDAIMVACLKEDFIKKFAEDNGNA
jgi:RimJ/RimL family protein N-acetyltransferase